MWNLGIISGDLWPTYQGFFSSVLLNLYLVIFFFICTLCFSNNFPTHMLPENVCTRSIKESMTQIDVMRFGKFKALTNYSKVGKHTHMKHLFVGAGNLSGGLSCVKTSILTMLRSSPSLSQRSVRRLSQSFTTFPPPLYLWNALSNTNKQCSSVLQGSLLLSLVTK